jgi:nicotinamide mononucleotide transporter
VDDLPAAFYRELLAWSGVELIAVVLAIAYLLLAIRQNIWCWVCAGFSTAIYVWLFYEARLYMESLLNVFYFGMAIYGWYSWSTGDDSHDRLPVGRWPAKVHVFAISFICLLVAVVGGWLQQTTDAAFPFIDSATTFAAMWATFLVARKVLENWYYWLVIDIASIFIYASRGLEMTALLFVVYVVLIPFGIVNWTRSWRRETESALS